MTTLSGTVRGREAVVTLSIEDAAGLQHEIEAVLDTGFTGYLVLPPAVIRQLGLARRGRRRMTLADGTVRMHHFYGASVTWRGEQYTVPTYGTGDKPLIGMRLLEGSRVTLDVTDGGPVAIESLPA